MLTGADIGRFCPGSTLASSATQSFRGAGLGKVAVSDVLCPRGPCTNGPASAKPINGGVFPVASLNGAKRYKGFRLAGTTEVFPLAVKVQVSFSLKALGTVTVKTPH